ncbi:methylisocitrate lyase [Nitrospira japonica]|nr:methylisocitrate lyase [Nitrospira japonica]
MRDERGTRRARRFRELLDKQTLILPGAFNALTAMQIERAGFHALYVSGAGMSAARGLPDIGLLSLTEAAYDSATITKAVAIPAIVDADTGFGPPLAVMRTVKEFEAAGLAGMQIEDQEMPKKCGHLPGKRVVPTDDMAGKIRAAADARQDPDFFIIARTDARAIEGLESAVRRARIYIDAGADAIFPEALESADEFRTFARHLAKEGGKAPLVANMTEFGKTPYLSVAEFEELGYRLVLFPVTALRMATQAVDEMLSELKTRGSQRGLLERMYTRTKLYDLLRYADYEQWDRRVHSTEDGHANR